MSKCLLISAATALLLAACPVAWGQVEKNVEEATAEAASAAEEAIAATAEKADEMVDEISTEVDQSDKAQEISAGILKPIHALAERLSFPAFHAVAFGLMVAGVVSFALQLVLGKLVVLSKLGLSVTEILSDALGFVVSLVGLVLTTQAAAENSTFTQSAWAVISSATIGAIVGFIFYIWGQRHELQAVEGRRIIAAKAKAKTKPAS